MKVTVIPIIIGALNTVTKGLVQGLEDLKKSTPSLPSLPGPLRPRVVALGRVLSIGQIELNCVLMLN